MKRKLRKLAVSRETLRALETTYVKGGTGIPRTLFLQCTTECNTLQCSEAYTICCPPTETQPECGPIL